MNVISNYLLKFNMKQVSQLAYYKFDNYDSPNVVKNYGKNSITSDDINLSEDKVT